MVTIEKLKEMKKKEKASLKKWQDKLAVRKEKDALKMEIREMKAAKMRAAVGIDKGDIDRFEGAFKATAKSTGGALKSGLGMLGKGLLGAGEAAEKYYGKKNKRR